MEKTTPRLIGALVAVGIMWGLRVMILRVPLPPPEPVQIAQPVVPPVFAPAFVEGVPAASKVAPAEPPRPQTPLVRREILAPTGGMKDEATGSIASFKHATVNADGTRVLTVSEREIICWDATTGKALQTFRRGNHWKTPMFAAPDATTVVVLDRDKKAVVVRNAETGAVVGTYTVKKAVQAHRAGVPGFNGQGTEFVFVEPLDHHAFNVHAVSTRTGQGRVLARNLRMPGPKGDLNPHHLFPVPGRSVLLTQLAVNDRGTPPQSIYALDTTNGRSWPVTWLGERQRGIDFPGEGLRFSPDGRQLAIRNQSRVTVGDWATGAESYSYPADGQYRFKHHPVFTPDGKRMVVLDVWDRDWYIMYLGKSGPPRGFDQLQLFDLTTHAKLAGVDEKEFTDGKGICSSLAISGNGRVLVLRRPERLLIVDFERTFGVAPLPVEAAGSHASSGH